MTCIEADGTKFLHASDIQFLDKETAKEIMKINPDIVLASGPPLYLEAAMKDKRELAWENLIETSKSVKTLILDHHLLRCAEGVAWLERLKGGV